MAQKNLTANVVLKGKVDSSVQSIGEKIGEMRQNASDSLIDIGGRVQELGQEISEASRAMINFGKESVEVYKNYNYSMSELESVWGSNGTFQKGSRQMANAMKTIDEAASEWAANSIFHTNDIANAMVEAAHAGWDLDKMLGGMPAAMHLAQAGGMDLSESVNYVLKSMQGLGLGYEDLNTFVDEWIYAANRSAGTAEEFGDTMLAMGSTMQFAENRKELLTLVSTMANMGITGSAAGTMIRNSMLRILAPTKTAQKDLDALGASEEELLDIMEDMEVSGAADQLSKLGFSAFDEKGQAKPVLQIYSELGALLADVAGGYDKIGKNEQAISILKGVFGARSLTGALNLITQIGEATKLYGELSKGAAEGTGEYVAALMGESLWGQEELMKSKIENLQLLVGEELAPKVEKVMGFVGGIVDSIAGMDDGKLSAIVSGLTSVAGTGIGLTIAGGALKLLGLALSPAGALAIGVTTVVALTEALHDLQNTEYANQFGDMTLDTEELSEFVRGLGSGFDEAWKNVDKFRAALNQSVEGYKTASETFSSELLTNVLKGTKLTDEDKTALEKMGIEMYTEVVAAINASGDMSAKFLEMLAGGDGVAEFDPAYQELIDILQKDTDGLTEQAAGIQKKVHDAMMQAWEDNEFTEEEYQTILGYMREYNSLIARAQAEAANEEAFVQQRKMLDKAQTASIEDVQKMASTTQAERDARLDELASTYYAELYRFQEAGLDPNSEKGKRLYGELEKWYQGMRTETSSGYDEFLTRLWRTAAEGSDLAGQYADLENIAGMYMSGLFGDDVNTARGMWTGDRGKMLKFLNGMVESYGGLDTIKDMVAGYEASGNTEMADRMRTVLGMYEIISGGGPNGIMQPKISETVDSTMQEQQRYTLESARELAKHTTGEGNLGDYLTEIGKFVNGEQSLQALEYAALSGAAGTAMEGMIRQFGEEYDLGKIFRDMISTSPQLSGVMDENMQNQLALYGLMYGGYDVDKWHRNLAAEARGGSKFAAYSGVPIYANEDYATPKYEIEGAAEAGAQAVTEAQAAIDAAGPNTQTMVITPVIGNWGGGGVEKSFGMPQMARGGREDQPTIFAEAGIPEWYIPEEHSPNTARLLLGAMYNSGFSIFDLAEAAGARMFAEGGTTGSGLSWGSLSSESGSSGGGAGSSISVQYSPVIHADNASGVNEMLKKDKERMQKWFEEWWERKNLYESMTVYT